MKAEVITGRAEHGLIGSTWGKDGVWGATGSQDSEIRSQREKEGQYLACQGENSLYLQYLQLL